MWLKPIIIKDFLRRTISNAFEEACTMLAFKIQLLYLILLELLCQQETALYFSLKFPIDIEK